MLRRRNLLIGIVIVVSLPVAALAWWLASPLFIDKAVDEEFLFAASAIVPTDMTIGEVEKIMMDSASVDTPVDEAMPDFMVMNSEAAKDEMSGIVVMDKEHSEVMTDKTSDAAMAMDEADDKTEKSSDIIAMDKPDDNAVTDKMPDATAMDKNEKPDEKMSEAMAMDTPHGDAMSEDKPQVVDTSITNNSQNAMTAPAFEAMALEKMEDASNEEPATDAMMAQSSAAKLKEGSFRDADRSHRGSGTATIYRGPDGRHLLRLEDFSVTNGPDLRVILSPHENPTRRQHVTSGEYIELDKLKGNKGNQNYVIPDGVDISAFNSIVIYCKPFHVIFSVASLEDVN